MPTSTLSYELDLQNTDTDEIVGVQAVVQAVLTLPDDIAGSAIYSIAASAVDTSLPILNANGVDLVLFQALDKEVIVKFNSIAGTAFPVRAGGVFLLDTKNITSVYVSNEAITAANVRLIQARVQPLPVV